MGRGLQDLQDLQDLLNSPRPGEAGRGLQQRVGRLRRVLSLQTSHVDFSAFVRWSGDVCKKLGDEQVDIEDDDDGKMEADVDACSCCVEDGVKQSGVQPGLQADHGQGGGGEEDRLGTTLWDP